jgi:hypothetical protein
MVRSRLMVRGLAHAPGHHEMAKSCAGFLGDRVDLFLHRYDRVLQALY